MYIISGVQIDPKNGFKNSNIKGVAKVFLSAVFQLLTLASSYKSRLFTKSEEAF